MQPRASSTCSCRASQLQRQDWPVSLTLILTALLVFATAMVPRAASTLLLDVPFDEGSLWETANAGLYRGIGSLDPGVGGAGEFPRFSLSVPLGPWAPDGNPASMDFGTVGSDEGGRGIDFWWEAIIGFGDSTPASGLMRFTVAGWINLHSTEIGPGGNRILSTWPNGSTGTLGSGRQRGIDLVVVSDSTPSTTGARLRLGVNGAPDQDLPGPHSSDGKLRVGEWVFFAVTYDNGQVAYYFGDSNTPAALDVTATYNRQGLMNSGSPVTLGNFQPTGGTQTIRDALGSASCMLRGMVDEIEVYASALSLDQVRAVQINGVIPASLPVILVEPEDQTVLAGQDATFTVSATGTPWLIYHWQREGTTVWSDTAAPTYTLTGVTAADNGSKFRVRITDGVGSVTSGVATLTIAPDITPPTVVAVETTRTLTALRIRFSEPVEAATAEDIFNYALTLDAGPVALVSAVLQPSLTEVRLTTDPLTPGAQYSLSIMNVRDRVSPPNTMADFAWEFTAVSPPRMEPLIEVRFEEGAGGIVANSGSAGGTGTIDSGLASSTPNFPSFTNNVPIGPYAPSGNLYSLNTGTNPGHAQFAGKAVDFPYEVKRSTLGLEEFTITGWINVTDRAIGSGGNRIVGTWPNHASNIMINQLTGFDVVVESNGRLRIGINQAPDYPTPPGNIGTSSSTGKVPVRFGANPGNWVFFAITYDTAPASENVRFYFGNGSTLAAQDTEATLVDYNRGAIVDASVPRDLTLANFVSGTPDDRAFRDSISDSRAFRGLMDEIRFFSCALTLEEIQQVQTRGGDAEGPSLAIVIEGGQVAITWTSTGTLELVYKDLLDDAIWTPVTETVASVGNLRTVRVSATQATRFYSLRPQ